MDDRNHSNVSEFGTNHFQNYFSFKGENMTHEKVREQKRRPNL